MSAKEWGQRNRALMVVLFFMLALSLPLKLAAQAAEQPEPAKPVEFVFGGGDFSAFLQALRKQFGNEVMAAANIPPNVYRLQVPKMRLQLTPIGTAGYNLSMLLNLYNQISENGDYSLGKWFITGYGAVANGKVQPPNVLVFFPPKPAILETQEDIQVRAFPTRGMTDLQLQALEKAIREESGRLQDLILRGIYGPRSESFAMGDISFHKGVGVLVASGGKLYVSLVGTMLEAYRANEEKPANPPGSSKPADPPASSPKARN